MGVLNGATYLGAQLASIAAQTHRNWQLVCSDDGSSDASKDILARFAQEHPGKIIVQDGPRAGFAANYMKLISDLAPDVGHVCFADQDDIWSPDKIALALEALGEDQAELYCGRVLYWYADTGFQFPSRAVRRPCHLRNALIENVASGNTILLSPTAARLVRTAGRQTGAVFAHDWWLYLLITATGGKVYFDNGPPQVLYRQHHNNQIGAGHGWRAQWERKRSVMRGAFAQRIAQNLAALAQVEDLLTPQAVATIAGFADARQSASFARLRRLQAIRPYRQHWQSNLGFWGAACLARI